jgi:uncharacterized membrane protein
MRVEASVQINRAVPEVFRYVSDVHNYPEWMAHVLEVRSEALGPPQQSDEFVVAIKSMGRRFETKYERTAYEAGRQCTDRALGGPIPNQRWQTSFGEVSGGTHMTRAVEVESTGLLKLLEPLQKWSAGRQMKKDLQTLKGLLEH